MGNGEGGGKADGEAVPLVARLDVGRELVLDEERTTPPGAAGWGLDVEEGVIAPSWIVERTMLPPDIVLVGFNMIVGWLVTGKGAGVPAVVMGEGGMGAGAGAPTAGMGEGGLAVPC